MNDQIKKQVEKLALIDKDHGQLDVVMNILNQLHEANIPQDTKQFFLRDKLNNHKTYENLSEDIPQEYNNPIISDFSSKSANLMGGYIAINKNIKNNIKTYEYNNKPTYVKPLEKITISQWNKMNDDQKKLHMEQVENGYKQFKNHGFIKKTFPRQNKISVSIKDLFWIKGENCSNSSKMLQNFIAPENSTIVERLINSDCYISMVTNNDEFACGAYGNKSGIHNVYSPIFVDNEPLVLGGSSSGCAGSVASGLSMVSIGSETGGSVRYPAHCAGIYGFKPSPRLISRYGMMELNGEVDTAGIFANSVEDINHVFDIIKGLDPKDETLIMPKPKQEKKVIGLFGSEVYKELGIDLKIQEIKDKFPTYTFKEVNIKNLDYAIMAYSVLTMTNLSSINAKFNNLLYGDGSSIGDLFQESRTELFGPEVKRRITAGCYLSRLDDSGCIKKARQLLFILNQEVQKIFADCDLIIGPVGPTAPTFKDSFNSDIRSEYLCDKYLCFVNLLGLCGISIPVGLKEGRPFSIQVIGDYGSDQMLLDFTKKI